MSKTLIDDSDDDERLTRMNMVKDVNFKRIKNRDQIEEPEHHDRVHANEENNLTDLANITGSSTKKAAAKKKTPLVLSAAAKKLMDLEAGVSRDRDDDDEAASEDLDFINDDDDDEYDFEESEEGEEDSNDEEFPDEFKSGLVDASGAPTLLSEEEEEYDSSGDKEEEEEEEEEGEEEEEEDGEDGPSDEKILKYEIDTVCEFESQEQMLVIEQIPPNTNNTLYQLMTVLLGIIGRDYLYVSRGYQEDENQAFFTPTAETAKNMIIKEKKMSIDVEIRSYQIFYILFMAPYISYIHKKFKGRLSDEFDAFLRVVERTNHHTIEKNNQQTCMVSGGRSMYKLTLYINDPEDEDIDLTKEIYKGTPFYVSEAWWRWVRTILVLIHFYSTMLNEFHEIFTKNEIGIDLDHNESIALFIKQEVLTLSMRFLYFIYPFFKKAGIMTSLFSCYQLKIGK